MALLPHSGHRRVATVLMVLLCAACGGTARPVSGPPISALPDSAPVVLTFNLHVSGPDSLLTQRAAPYTSGALSVQTVGSFQILEEKDTSSIPLMHVSTGWTKLRLLFTTADRLAYVLLEDDGAGVTIAVQVPTCYSRSRYYQYRDREDESYLYDAMASNLQVRLRTCPTQPAAADEYLREFQRGSRDFPVAIRLFKARAVAVYRALKPRCRTPAALHYPTADLYQPCQ